MSDRRQCWLPIQRDFVCIMDSRLTGLEAVRWLQERRLFKRTGVIVLSCDR